MCRSGDRRWPRSKSGHPCGLVWPGNMPAGAPALWWAALAVLARAAAACVLEAHSLTVNYAVEPMAVHDPAPRLAWKLRVAAGQRAVNETQSAAQVQAASSLAALLSGKPDLWDSGLVRAAGGEGRRGRAR